MSMIVANHRLSLGHDGASHWHCPAAVRVLIAIVMAATIYGINVSAQAEDRRTESNGRAWYMYFGDHPIRNNSPWGFHFDGQLRMEGAFERRNQLLLRPGLNYDLNETVQFSGGYAFINTNPPEESPPNFDVPENRVWQQLILRQRVGTVGLTHRYRLEQRFIGNVTGNDAGEGEVLDHFHVNRFRYFIKGTVPLYRDDRYVAFYNELMVGFGDNVKRNIFDQNRAYGAIGFRTGPSTSFEIGYLLQTVQRPTGNVIQHNHTFQLGYFTSRPLWPR